MFNKSVLVNANEKTDVKVLIQKRALLSQNYELWKIIRITLLEVVIKRNSFS